MNKVLAVLIGIILVLATLSGAYADSYTYTHFDYPGASQTYAYGINDAGTIVGTYWDAGGVRHGYSLTGGAYTPLNVPGASQTYAYGINNAGVIVGWYWDADGVSHGYSLTGGVYTHLNVPGALQTVATGINDAGTIVGNYSDGSVYHGFSLTGTTYTPIDYPGASLTQAMDINGSGTTIVGVYRDGVYHGFSLTGTTYTPIDYPGAPQTGLQGINDAGTIVGWYYYPEVGFSLTGTTYTLVKYPGAPCSAYGINNAGVIVGRYTDGSGVHGFLAIPILPIAICKDVTVAAGSGCTATASIDNGSYEPDGNPVTLTQTPAGPYPLGHTTATLTVADSKTPSSQSQCTGTVTVQDKTSPVITMASVNPSALWPPNHKMVDVTVNYTSTDNCSSQPICRIVGVISNEPISSSDYSIVDAHHVALSAERLGSGNGRMYTISIVCTDTSGNPTTQTVAVSVPHDQGKN